MFTHIVPHCTCEIQNAYNLYELMQKNNSEKKTRTSMLDATLFYITHRLQAKLFETCRIVKII